MPDHPRGPRPKRNYAEYLNLYYLLDLQRDDEDASVDEQHFIVVHQIFELWFKLIIHELVEASDLLNKAHVPEEEIPRVVHKLNRCTQIFKLLAQQWKVVETLQPQDFLAFRDGLGTASGFESFQIRQLEMMVGVKQSDRPQNFKAPLDHFREMAMPENGGDSADQTVLAMMERLDKAKPLVDTIENWLARTPIDGSLPSDDGDDAVINRFVDKYLGLHHDMQKAAAERMRAGGLPEERILKAEESQKNNRDEAAEWLRPEGKVARSRAALLFIESYRELPMLAWPRQLLDQIIELEEAMLLFRFCHARMVERMIGRRVGTGGSSGVAYLDSTLNYRVFKDVWRVRTLLIKKDALFPLDTKAAKRFYDYQGDTRN